MLELQFKYHAWEISPSILYGNYFLKFEFRPNFIIYVFRKFQNTQYVISKKFKAKATSSSVLKKQTKPTNKPKKTQNKQTNLRSHNWKHSW